MSFVDDNIQFFLSIHKCSPSPTVVYFFVLDELLKTICNFRYLRCDNDVIFLMFAFVLHVRFNNNNDVMMIILNIITIIIIILSITTTTTKIIMSIQDTVQIEEHSLSQYGT